MASGLFLKEFLKFRKFPDPYTFIEYTPLHNNQVNVRALIGQAAIGYCAGKPMEKSLVFWRSWFTNIKRSLSAFNQ